MQKHSGQRNTQINNTIAHFEMLIEKEQHTHTNSTQNTTWKTKRLSNLNLTLKFQLRDANLF